jgi:CDP-diacylglycerol--serine O-phosphatidyltransferase
MGHLMLRSFGHRLAAAAPNLITLAGMFAGMAALRFVWESKLDNALAALLVAVVLDGLDGYTARRLSRESAFGANLDNLSDFLSFGVLPAMFLYAWLLNGLGLAGWLLALVYTAGAAVRLARFGAAWSPSAGGAKPPFRGLPSPAAAVAVLLPYYVSHAVRIEPELVLAATGLCAALVAFFMVCRAPVPAASHLVRALNARAPGLAVLLAAWVLAGLAIAPYTTLSIASSVILIMAAILITSASLASPLKGDAWKSH